MQKESVVSYFPGIYLEALTKPTKFSFTTAGIRAPELNPEPPKHDAGGLCTRMVDCCLRTMILSVSTRSLLWTCIYVWADVAHLPFRRLDVRPSRLPHANNKLPTTAGIKRFKCSSFVSSGNDMCPSFFPFYFLICLPLLSFLPAILCPFLVCLFRRILLSLSFLSCFLVRSNASSLLHIWLFVHSIFTVHRKLFF